MTSGIGVLPNVARLLWGLLRDPRVSRLDRGLFIAAVVYLVSPIDLIPDWILVFGQLDDAFVLLLATRRLLSGAELDVIRAHWRGDPAWLEREGLPRLVRLASWFLPASRRRRTVGR